MRNQHNGDDDSGEKVRSREVFKDGSQLVELENGSLLLLEGKSSKALMFAEQPAPYSEPPPKPKAL
jgi:hypothetical protein